MGLPVPDEYFHNNPGAAAGGPGSGSGSGVALKTEPMDSDTVVGDEEALTAKGGDGRGSSGGKDGKDKDGGKDGDEAGGVVKANKGMILRKSVEYIRSVFGQTVQFLLLDVFFRINSESSISFNHLNCSNSKYLQVSPTTSHGARCSEQGTREGIEDVSRRTCESQPQLLVVQYSECYEHSQPHEHDRSGFGREHGRNGVS